MTVPCRRHMCLAIVLVLKRDGLCGEFEERQHSLATSCRRRVQGAKEKKSCFKKDEGDDADQDNPFSHDSCILSMPHLYSFSFKSLVASSLLLLVPHRSCVVRSSRNAYRSNFDVAISRRAGQGGHGSSFEETGLKEETPKCCLDKNVRVWCCKQSEAIEVFAT